MTSYTKSTNFATKDTLTSGDPLKIVKGTELNTEFDNIATAVNSKSDTASPTFTGTVTIPTLGVTGTTTLTGVATLTANPVLSAGTANGVTYLNGSKSLTSGAAITFDGTNFATTGTATATKLIPTGTSVTGNGLYLPAANSLGLSTNGTNAVYIDASQNVLVGTTTAIGKISVYGTTSTTFMSIDGTGQYKALELYATGIRKAYFNIDSTSSITTLSSTYNTLVFSTGDTERMRIDGSGNVGIGTSSPTAFGAGYTNLAVSGSTSGVVQAINSGNSVTAEMICSTDTGRIGTRTNHALVLKTNDTERMRIDTSGNLLVGTTTSVSGSNHVVVGSNSVQGIKKDFTNLSTTNQSFGFTATGGGVLIGNMKSIGGASVAFILSAVYNNSAIDIYTTTLGNCTAGGNAGTISGINGDARTYTFSRNASSGELQVTASSTATGTTTIYLTPLNQYA